MSKFKPNNRGRNTSNYNLNNNYNREKNDDYNNRIRNDDYNNNRIRNDDYSNQKKKDNNESSKEDNNNNTNRSDISINPSNGNSNFMRVEEEEVEGEKELNLKLLDSFEELNLKENLLRGIYAYGFEVPSRIQSYSIPYMLQKKDIIAQSQSGTGKTGAFTIGILSAIDETKKYPQGLVLCNTHELASQIHSVITELGKYMEINVGLLIGGVQISKNIEDAKNCQILVGTPGRVRDLLERGVFNPNLLKIFVIDEADELLQHEFLDQTKYIITEMSNETQICIFSATMPSETLAITKHFMPNPIKILVKREKLSLDLIAQYYINVNFEQYKFETLEDLYGKLSINQCIIYVNSVKKADILKEQLTKQMHVAEVIHSKLENKQRMDIMARFRKGEFRVLISTDLICRGIDIHHINYVINYDVPFDPQSYLHRIGRSGRFGKKGIAINFVTQRDYYQLKSIERFYNNKIEPMPDPSVINELGK